MTDPDKIFLQFSNDGTQIRYWSRSAPKSVMREYVRKDLSGQAINANMLEALRNAQATLKHHGITPLIKVDQAIAAAEKGGV